ncbi:MAG: 4-hydroxy-tetrahydrodipicolinate reductase [Bacillota bacterium]
MARIRVLVNGATGKMGRVMSAGIAKQPDMEIVSAVDVKLAGLELGNLCGIEPLGIAIEEDLAKAIEKNKPDIMVDFTNPQAVMKNVQIALPLKVACVVGTTGLSQTEMTEVERLTKEYDTPAFFAANFALGAVLMMRFAQQAAVYFPHVEIVEKHHDQKIDAPSGTAIATLEMIAKEREVFVQGMANEFEKIPCSRGGDYQGMRVHSMRLPGYIASQEVVFGAPGQILTISHEAMSRESFLPGVLMAIRKVLSLNGLTFGLESIM